MTKRKDKRPLKVVCDAINGILTLKRLEPIEIEVLKTKLKNLVQTSKPGNSNVFQYVKLVIAHILDKDEQKSLSKILDSLDTKKPQELLVVQNILASIYNSITEVYPTLKIEEICEDINGMIPPYKAEDEEFGKFIEKELSNLKKIKKKKVTKYEFNTIEQVEELGKYLSSKLIGQNEAIQTVCNMMKLKSVNFVKTISLFFIGKTGRGKTELARLLGDKYSGNFWLINCAEMSNGHEVNKILGAPPGYIGHSDTSLLKENASKSNRWVIVFDEIEKASPKFYNFLLSLMETGTCTDNIGTKIDLSDSIFIFTSNCGLKELKKDYIGMGKKPTQSGDKEELIKALENEFSPEFRNRIDEIIFFNDLTKEDSKKITELRLKEYPIKATPELINYIVENGFNEEFGARGLGRFIKKMVALPLADAILQAKTPHDGTTKFDAVINKGVVEIVNTSAI